MRRILVLCTTDSMIWNFLVPHIKELEARGYYVECACSVTGDFYKNLVEKYNIKMNKLPFERAPYKIKNILAYKKLYDLIKKKKFNTIFCHEPVGGAMGRIAGHACGCKVIYMAHGFHFYRGAPKSKKIYYIIEKVLSNYTDVLITINEEDYAVSLGFSAKKNYKLNGIGVDTRKFQYNSKEKKYFVNQFQLSDSAVTVLSVGELIPRKNHAVIIKAIAELKDKDLYYFIAGEGKNRKDLENLISQLKIQDHVFLLGYRTDISRLCNAADIFAMPSIQEGLSVALMEAMVCRKPVICSKIRGNVDLIDNALGGYLCEAYDISEYADKIRQLKNSVELRTKFGEYNSIKVEKFDIEIIKAELIKIIETN